MRKTFLVLLVVVCLAVAGWNGYLLFTNQTDPLIGWIILAVSIGVLVWNISLLRAYRVRAGTVIAVFLVVALLAMTVSAFAGIEPFAEIKDSIVLKVSGIFAVGEDVAAHRTVRATIDAFNKGRGDRLADLATTEVYNILTDWLVGDHPVWILTEIVDYDLMTLRSNEDWCEILVRGGVKDRTWGAVTPYEYVYVVRTFDSCWVVTDIIPSSR